MDNWIKVIEPVVWNVGDLWKCDTNFGSGPSFDIFGSVESIDPVTQFMAVEYTDIEGKSYRYGYPEDFVSTGIEDGFHQFIFRIPVEV